MDKYLKPHLLSPHLDFPNICSDVFSELSGPVLRDTARLSQRYPPIARYGVFGVSTWPIGCDTPSPFSARFPLGEHAKWRCDTPPQKGYLSDTCAIPYENKANGCDTPLCDTISKGYCAIGGVSRTGPLSFRTNQGNPFLPTLRASPRVEFSRPQKGPAERGHVKKRQKLSKSVKTIFDTFRHFSCRAKNVKHRSGKSKRGLSKGGLSPKGANRAKKGPFGAISALPPWLWVAEELVPIGPEKAPTSPEMAPICLEKARFSGKDFPPIFSENLGGA